MNLSVSFIEENHGRFHSGFTDAYHMAQAQVRRYVDKVKPQNPGSQATAYEGQSGVAFGIDYTLTSKYRPTLITFGNLR